MVDRNQKKTCYVSRADKQHGRLSYKGVLTFEFACICRNHQESSSSSHGNIDRVNSITKAHAAETLESGLSMQLPNNERRHPEPRANYMYLLIT
ncbi:hypothetical protein Tco_1349499 [Tanacetum coccineum]